MTLKDHLRSLSDKQMPADPLPGTSESNPDPIPAMKDIQGGLVTISADQKSGMGFLVDGQGKVATNFHLVNGARKIKVTGSSGDVFLAKAPRLDESRDLALLQIPAKALRFLTLGDSGGVDVGDEVFLASGSSGDLAKAVVSALRNLEGALLIQIDRSIDPEHSGSPLVTKAGTVVGIASYLKGRQEENAGFAVSARELKQFLAGE